MNDTQFGASGVHSGYSSSFTVTNGTERSSVTLPTLEPRRDDTDTTSPQKLCRRPGRRHDTERPPVASTASEPRGDDRRHGHSESTELRDNQDYDTMQNVHRYLHWRQGRHTDTTSP